MTFGEKLQRLRARKGLSQDALAELLDVSQSAVSHQLRVLKDAELVTRRRDGKTIYYSLADEHVRAIIEMGFEHITEEYGGD